MPTVLRDSKELIQILESIKITPDCLLVTADVRSLYPNINIKKAIIALDLLLRENRVPETPLLIQLARIVFENNFLTSEFSNDIFHQTTNRGYKPSQPLVALLKLESISW